MTRIPLGPASPQTLRSRLSHRFVSNNLLQVTASGSLVALGTFTGLACYRYNSSSQAPVMDLQDGQFDAVFLHQSPEVLLSTVLQVAVVLRRTCCYPRSSLDPETSSAFYALNPVSVRVECIIEVATVTPWHVVLMAVQFFLCARSASFPDGSWISLRRSRFRFGT